MSDLSNTSKQLFLALVWAVMVIVGAYWLQGRQWARVAVVLNPQDPPHAYTIDWGIWFSAVVVWGVAVASGIWLKRLGDAPIEEFTSAACAVRDQDYTSRLPKSQTRRDSWGDLYLQFREMQHAVAAREKSMQDDNDCFRTVLNSMNEGVLAINVDGEIILANQSVCRLLLFSDEVVGNKLTTLVRLPELRAAIEATQQTGQFQSTEFKTLHDSRKTLNARLTSLGDSLPTGVAIVFQDVSELRALETMRRDFVANVSHELKTPLASIKAYAETLRMGAINDQEKNVSFVEQIEAQADHLHLQIQDLMEIARVESGKIAQDVEPVALNEVCENCFHTLVDLARKMGQELLLNLSTENSVVTATEAGLETILENLVSNAIHYTPAGGKVFIETTIEEGYAVARVIDTGVGIAAQHHDRVFERFYRVDKARSREMGGTGLGLAIVKHLAQAFNGTVTLDSKVGKGTTFTVRLPLA